MYIYYIYKYMYMCIHIYIYVYTCIYVNVCRQDESGAVWGGMCHVSVCL